MDITQHFQTIWRRRWLVLGASLVIAGLVFGWREHSPRTYKATAVLLVVPARSQSQTITQSVAQYIAQTYGTLATTKPLLAEALSSLVGSPQGDTANQPAMSPTDAQRRISVDTTTTPGYIAISATGRSPADAGLLAQAVSKTLVTVVERQQANQKRALIDPITQQIDALQAQLDSLSTTDTGQRAAVVASFAQLLAARAQAQLQAADVLQSVSPATDPRTPISPRPLRDGVLALLVALIVNSELAVALEALSDRFTSADATDEIARVTGVPVLARIPRGGDAEHIEEIRSLRTSLMFTTAANGIKTLAIVGVEPGSGKSFTSHQLAASMAGLDIDVLLIDGDMRRPRLHEYFARPLAPGLSDVLQGVPMDLKSLSVPDVPGLYLLAAGSPFGDPAGLLGGSTLVDVTRQLPEIDFTIIDTPAAAFFADAVAIASQCDATLIVVNARKSRRRAVRQLVDQLRQVDARPLGVVVNWSSGGNKTAQYYATRRTPITSRRS